MKHFQFIHRVRHGRHVARGAAGLLGEAPGMAAQSLLGSGITLAILRAEVVRARGTSAGPGAEAPAI